MAARTEFVRISSQDGDLGMVKKGWALALQSMVAGVVMDTTALTQVIGVSRGALGELRGKGIFFTLQSMGPDEWLWTLKGTSPNDPSLKEAYLGFVESAFALAFTSQRPDLLDELTLPAQALFEQLPEGVKSELRGQGKAPDKIVAHDAAF